MSKKITFLFLAVIMALFALAGCKDGEEPTTNSVTRVEFDKQEITLKVGESVNINATVEPDELSDAKLTWKSSDKSVATVSRGLVTAVSEGQAVITAVSENGKLDSCIVTVIENDDEDDKKPEEDDKKPEEDDNTDSEIEIGSEIGNKCPNFSVPLIDSGETVKLSDYIGKSVVINLWGTWCGPCKAELPDLDRIASDYDGEAVVLTIHSVSGLKNAANYINNNFPDSKILFAQDVPLTVIKDKYFDLLGGTDYYPRTLILDEKGIIRFAQDGKLSYSQVADVLDSITSDDEDDKEDEPAVPEINLVSYTVKISTVGGMSMSKCPIYFYEYTDGTLGEFLDFCATDENGEAEVKLPEKGSYAVVIDQGIPDGYILEPFYPFTSQNLDIKITSDIIEDTMPNGHKYNLGDVMYDFTVTTSDNKQFKLSEVLKEKKAVLINFWYTDCSWCAVEFPLMQNSYEKFSDDIAIIALDPIDYFLDDIIQFKSEYGLTFDVAQDLSGLYEAFDVTGYPTSVMIDRYGVICLIEPGAITNQGAFDRLFAHFTSDNYEQKLVVDYNDIGSEENEPEEDFGDDIQIIDGSYHLNSGDRYITSVYTFKGNRLTIEKSIYGTESTEEYTYEIKVSNNQQTIILTPYKQSGSYSVFECPFSMNMEAPTPYVVINGNYYIFDGSILNEDTIDPDGWEKVEDTDSEGAWT